MKLTEDVLSYIDAHSGEALELLMKLAQIPAPSHMEHKRAEFCKNWLQKQGAEGVYIDDALNVVYPIHCNSDKPICVFMAHSDVVFPDTTPLPLSVSDGKIFCSGVGDDTANVVLLLMCAKFIAQRKIMPIDHGILLVVNSCEEGLGNLKGCRKIMDTYSTKIAEFITFDGSHNKIVNRAVGSQRDLVEVHTEGGHSYGDFGKRNAIATLASMINKLYAIEIPAVGKTTFNVDTIAGGTSVNTIAQNAQMLFEFRSDEKEGLKAMEHQFQAVIDEYRNCDIDITVTLLGNRPCGYVQNEIQNKLMKRAAEAVQDHFGLEPQFCSGSTDCNIPLSMGIAALCVGCVETYGAHTREEYVLIDSLKPGLGVAFQLIMPLFNEYSA